METTVHAVNGLVLISLHEADFKVTRRYFTVEEALLLARQVHDALQGAEEDAHAQD